jgi:hypothetical protein
MQISDLADWVRSLHQPMTQCPPADAMAATFQAGHASSILLLLYDRPLSLRDLGL